MAVDISTIGIEFQTDGLIKGQAALKNTEQAANRAADAADKAGAAGSKGFKAYGDAASMAQRQTESLAKVTATFSTIFGTALAGLGASQLISQVDGYTKLTAQLKLASSSAAEYANSLNDVRRISKEAQSDLSATAVLYARIANGTRELGIGQRAVADITETVNLALKVSGATAQESASAMLQLSQSFGSGTLRGEEFNAVNEAAPRLMKALADGIGVPIGALKEMASNGQITSDVMARVLPKALSSLREEAKSVQTISGSITVLKNNIMEFVGVQAQANGSVSLLTGGIGLLAENLNLITSASAGFLAIKLSQGLISITSTAYAAVAANQAQTASTLAAAQAQVSATATASALAAARVVELRSAVLSAEGAVALAIATNGLVPAQARATVAAEAHTVALGALTIAQRATTVSGAVASGALSLLGGPIGVITTLLGLGVTAWLMWGKSSEEASKQAAGAVEQSGRDIISNLDKQIAKLRERLVLANSGNIDAAKAGGVDAEKMAATLTRINELKAKGNALTGSEKIALIEQQGIYDDIQSRVQTKTGIQAELDRTGKAATDLVEVRQRLAGVNQGYLDDLTKLKTALDKGAISQTDYIATVSELAKKTYDSSTAGKEANKGLREGASAAKAAETQYAGLLLRVNERIQLSNEELTAGRLLTDAEKQDVKLTELLDSGKSKLSATQRSSIETALAEVKAKELLVLIQRAELENIKQIATERQRIRNTDGDQAASALKDIQAAYAQSLASVNERIRSLTDEEEAVRLSAQQNISLATAVELVAIKRLQEKQTGFIEGSEGYVAIEREIAARTQLTGLVTNKDQREQWKAFTDDLNRGLTDSLFRAFESGKGFFAALWDGIKNLFKTTVLKLLISPVAGALTGALGLSGTAAAATSGGNAFSGLSSLGSIGSTISSIGGSLGSGLNAGFSALIGESGITGAISAGLTSIGTATGTGIAAGLGTLAGALGPIALGVAALPAISKALFGGDKSYTTGGITGSFGSGSFQGQNFRDFTKSGGLLGGGGSGTDYSALDNATQQQFSTQYAALQTATSGLASTLGLSADAVTNYSQSIMLTLGSDAKANSEAIATLFADVGDGLASAVAPGLFVLKKDGETASATLTRLSGSLGSVNAVLNVLRLRLFSTSLAGADAASKLADAFGGLDALASSSKAFYDTYYTEAERAQASTDKFTAALASLNLTVPRSKDELRDLVTGLDLNTESGRAAYATLLQLAPEFATNADLAARFAKETADKLLNTFTASGKLPPALDTAAAQAGLVADSVDSASGALGTISRLFLNVNSGLISFGAGVAPLRGSLTAAQVAGATLVEEIDQIQRAATDTTFDLVGLSEALASVDVATFMNVIDGILTTLAGRFKDTLGAVADERVAVRNAILQIIGPTVMSRDAIARGIAGVSISSAPGNAALLQAQGSLSAADNAVNQRKAALDSLRASGPDRVALDAAASALGQFAATAATALAAVNNYRVVEGGKFNQWVDRAFASNADNGTPNPSGERNAQNAVRQYQAAQAAQATAQAAYDEQVRQFGSVTGDYAVLVAQAQARLSESTTQQAAAVTQARAAQLQYITSLQDFSIDASKSVSRLSKLREETVKYYDAQKQLAGLLTTSAAAIRGTVDAYRFDQLDTNAQFDQLQARFATAYAMALSTDGEVLAGYGDKLNSLLNPLLAKAQDALSGTALDSFIATTLARADNIAGRIEALTPKDYAADSVALLGQIDGTLAAIDASARSAEKIIADAVNAGSDKTAQGLRAVIAALTGQPIPGFALGGSFAGGVRIVGENGPELEVTGPSRIYSNAQTRAMLGGGGDSAALVQEIRALRSEVSNLRAEARATAISNAAMQKLAERTYNDGQLVVTASDQPLKTTA